MNEQLKKAREILQEHEKRLRNIPIKTMQDAYDFVMICFNARNK